MNEERQRQFPDWIRTRVQTGKNREFVSGLVSDLRLNTVCQSAKCPNLNECWHSRTSTVMILGDLCTRACRFCAVPTGGMQPPDPDEPKNVAAAAAEMGLRFVVLTSVDRDDLPDKGAGHWKAVLDELHKQLPDAGVEVLTPDFQGEKDLVELVVDARPIVFNHNMETCERLTRTVRSANRYERSLSVLEIARKRGGDKMVTKSGIMVGLGETDDEVVQTIRDIHNAGVSLLTIGQYLRPSRNQVPVERYVHPDQFVEWGEFALDLGFKGVSCGPMVRSSYKAENLARKALQHEDESWAAFYE